jgi:hypothetical protein
MKNESKLIYYLSKISGREIIILHVLELIENIILDRTKEESSIMTDEGIRHVLEEKIKLCKIAGVKQVLYIIRRGRPSDAIATVIGERYIMI